MKPLVTYSNAPIRQESQSILSKIVTHWSRYLKGSANVRLILKRTPKFIRAMAAAGGDIVAKVESHGVEILDLHGVGFNLKTAKTLGFDIPANLLARASEVID